MRGSRLLFVCLKLRAIVRSRIHALHVFVCPGIPGNLRELGRLDRRSQQMTDVRYIFRRVVLI